MNVLMIAIDDMRPENTAYGAAHMHTPNIERLANRSMLFSRAYVQVAVCMPSRNALLFSRRPDTAKAWDISEKQFPRDCGGAACDGNVCGPTCGIREANGKLAVTLPGWFYQQGFFTIGAGKIFHEGANTQEQDYQHSWTPSTTNPSTGIYDVKGGPKPMYHGSVATPSWYAFDVEDEEMSETQLAEFAVKTIQNLSAAAADSGAGGLSKPFFLAVGFHKPHVPWYAPKKYWDFYPNDTATIAPHPLKPIGAPNIAMQSVMRAWSTPKKSGKLDCKYTDLCGEIYPHAPFADGRPGITAEHPFDNSSFPEWKALELRRAYWASLSFTDANIGRVLDALDASPFKTTTVIALWGDHG
jgi:arylsulfatase A-like enzyme